MYDMAFSFDLSPNGLLQRLLGGAIGSLSAMGKFPRDPLYFRVTFDTPPGLLLAASYSAFKLFPLA